MSSLKIFFFFLTSLKIIFCKYLNHYKYLILTSCIPSVETSSKTATREFILQKHRTIITDALAPPTVNDSERVSSEKHERNWP